MSYYRLSGYWFCVPVNGAPWSVGWTRKPKKVREERIVLDLFRLGPPSNAVDLYVFDKQLQLLVMDALNASKWRCVWMCPTLWVSLTAFAYLKPELFHDGSASKLDKDSASPAPRVAVQARAVDRPLPRKFVRHNRTKYGLPLAIWVACGWDFGTLSTLFNGMRTTEQDAIASQYGISDGRVFATWLRSLNYLRNVCAHHSRLWNRNIVDQPRLRHLPNWPG